MKKILLTFLSLFIMAGCGSNRKVLHLLNEGSTGQISYKTTIPFEYRLGLIVIEVEIKGVKYDFLLDTGAVTTLSPELVQKLDLRSVGKEQVYGIDGKSSELNFVKLEKISVDSLDFLNIGAAVTDFNKISTLKCLNVQGFLGANLMKESIWHFNFQKKEITIYSNKEDLIIPTNHKKSKLFVGYGGVPSITTRSKGYKFLNTAVDFGFSGGIVLSSRDFINLKNTASIKAYISGFGSSSVGIFSDEQSTIFSKGIIDEFEVGEIKINDAIVNFPQNGGRILGLSFFKDYLVILNWFDKEIIISENITSERPKYKTYGYGMSLKNNKLIIDFIYEGSNASKIGLRLGDQIISINDIETSYLSDENYCEIIQMKRFEEERIKVQRDGNVLEFSSKNENLLN